MKTNLIQESACRRVLEIEIPADLVTAERQDVMQRMLKVAAVPGFRPGKAPRGMLEKRLKPAIDQEVIENLVPKALQDAMEEYKVSPVGEPRLVRSDYEQDGALQIVIGFEVIPEVEPKEYRGLEVPFKAVEFKDDMVDRELERLRLERTELSPVEGRVAAEGDLVVLDAEIDPEGSPVEKLEALTMMVKPGLPYSVISLAAAGMEIGTEKQVDVEFPEDYYQKNLAGKKGKITLRLNSIKEQRLPELDDEFARSIGEFDTLDQLRARITEAIRKGIENDNKAARERRTVDKLVDAYDFDVPVALMDMVFRDRTRSTVNRMMEQGFHADHFRKVDWNSVREQETPNLARAVREMIILERISELEKLTVTEEDVQAEVARMAAEYEESEDVIRKQLLGDERSVEGFREHLRMSKVVDLLTSTAKYVEPPAGEHVHGDGCGCGEHHHE